MQDRWTVELWVIIQDDRDRKLKHLFAAPCIWDHCTASRDEKPKVVWELAGSRKLLHMRKAIVAVHGKMLGFWVKGPVVAPRMHKIFGPWQVQSSNHTSFLQNPRCRSALKGTSEQKSFDGWVSCFFHYYYLFLFCQRAEFVLLLLNVSGEYVGML